MARKIYGTIIDESKKPVKGLRVQAWDDDWPDGNDFMGEAITDSAGRYEINYHGGHWDPAPHKITTWRPDIFITVHIKSDSGDWAGLKKSGVYKNWKLRYNKKIDLCVPIKPTEENMTAFDPNGDGFKFRNSFSLSPALFGLDLGSWNIGLCGGMSAAAAHRFDNNQPIPNISTPPRIGALFDELLGRQKKSIPMSVISKIYDWQTSPDEGHWYRTQSVGNRTKHEWPKLKLQLDNGCPTQLVLIRVEGYVSNISDNHQVLAIGYKWNPTTKDLTIYDYDPNDPKKINTLTMNLGLTNSKLKAKDSTGKRLRGFFVNPAGPSAAA